jgi:GH24 family phage-related lysozyme (muramidase)
VSPAGLSFIASFEGWVDHPYNDPAGFATIGYGHLLHRSRVTAEDVQRWGKITHGRGLELLADDVESAETCILRNVRPPFLRQERFDALASFVYNLGCGPLSTDTKLRAAVNNPEREGMPDALLPYTHAGGEVLPGLVRRRKAEAHLWTTGEYQ